MSSEQIPCKNRAENKASRLTAGAIPLTEIAFLPVDVWGNGGETGIRTLGRRKPTTVFETAAFDHSATSPR